MFVAFLGSASMLLLLMTFETRFCLPHFEEITNFLSFQRLLSFHSNGDRIATPHPPTALGQWGRIFEPRNVLVLSPLRNHAHHHHCTHPTTKRHRGALQSDARGDCSVHDCEHGPSKFMVALCSHARCIPEKSTTISHVE
jgi:hypothetical protein